MKQEEERLSFRRGDAVAMIGVVLAALILLVVFLRFSTSGTQSAVCIYQEGKQIRELTLDQDGEYTVQGKYLNRVTVRDGRVCVSESDCPGEDCVHSGWISRPGQSIVCLPNRVEIRLEGTKNVDDVDAVVR